MRDKFNQKIKPKSKTVTTVKSAVANKISELLGQAIVLHKAGQLQQAKVIYEEALKLNPNHFDSIQLLATIALQNKLWDQALSLLNQAKSINNFSPIIYNNCGIALKELKRFEEALASYHRAIEIKPDYTEAYSNRGNVLRELKCFEEALASYDRAIELKPDYAEAYSNRGNVFNELNKCEEALINYDKAIELKPEYAEAYSNRGNVLKELKLFEEALSSYDRAIHFKPDSFDAHLQRGVVLKELKRFGDALVSYNIAIELKRDFTDAYYSRGVLFKELNLLEDALLNFQIVFSLNPNYPFIKGNLIHSMMYMNKWDSLYELLDSINNDVLEGKSSASPFGYQGICNSPKLLSQAAKIFSLVNFPSQIKPIKKIKKNKIKIGYLCGEFRNQATSILMINLWESHNKNKFELIGFDNGWNDGSHIRDRIEKAFDKLINISGMSDLSVASLINDESIDILINLNCFFGLQRNKIFAYKPAPIQVNYLGFPGTLGVDYMDYIIADKTVIPVYSQEHYSEKIVYLPNSYQVNDTQREIADNLFTKEEMGLPKEGFVFCCFNNNYKITPHTFDGWVRILKGIEGSVLWLLEDNSNAGINLRKEAQARGLDPNRLVFAKRMKPPEHLARHKLADLFLDTFPYNGHTTASDALWAGLPVLTHMGESFASRVAASLLKAIEIPELITTTQAQFEVTAIELATNQAKLKDIKNKLDCNRLTTSLFDTSQFTKHIEEAYVQMYKRYQSDLPIDHIYIDP
jgi:predicted O-linked N-acetylglucosamine transferase (SPINDLY family)